MDNVFEVTIAFNTTLLSILALIAFWMYYQRGRIQYEWVDDPIHDAAMPGNVRRMIQKHLEEGYHVERLESRGTVQIVYFNKRVKKPIARTGQVW